MLVGFNDFRIAFALRQGDRRDLLRQPTVANRRRCPFLRTPCKSVLILAGNLELFRHILCRFRHGLDAVFRLHPPVHKPPAKGGIVNFRLARKSNISFGHDQRRAAHAFHAACQNDLGSAGLNGLRRQTDGVKTRAAKAVNGQPRHAVRQPRQQRGHPRHVAVVFAGPVGAPHDNVVNCVGRKPRNSRHNRFYHIRQHIVRAYRT